MVDGLLNIVRREAAIAVASREFRGTLVVTAYNPKTYAVKGIILPHEVESGWVQLTGDHIGNGFGNLAGPKVGTADALDGDQFAIEFDRGDPNTLIATHRIFSDQDKPPQVQSGEILSEHQSGTKVFMDQSGQVTVMHGPSGNTIVMAQDKSITLTHGPTGSMIQIDKNGNHVHDAKGNSVTIQNTSGLTLNGALNVSGIANLGAGSLLGGLPIATT